MAKYIEDFNSKLDWAMPFQRTGKFPLDRTNMFDSYSDAVKYAKGDGSDSRALGGTSYVGQIIVVFENDIVTVYKINADRTIEALTSASGVDSDILDLQTQINTEIAARKAVDGQSGQTYSANSGATHISGATSLNDADIKLNNAITAETKARQDAIDAMNSTIEKSNGNFDISVNQVNGLLESLTISDITLSNDYNSVSYPEVVSSLFTAAKKGDTLDETVKNLDQNVSTLVEETLKNEKVVAVSFTEIKESVGLDSNLKYIVDNGATYIKDATSFSEADSILDNALATSVAAINQSISTLSSSTSNDLANEIAARKAIDGQSGQTYSANTTATHISGATSLNDADIKLSAALDKEITDRQAAINALNATVSGNGIHVDVTVSQLNGKITGVSVDESDIASASALTAEITARKAVDGQSSQTYIANTSSVYIKSATSLNDADIKLNDAISNLKLTAATASEINDLGTNVKEAYKLVDGNSTQHGDYIKIYKDSSLKSVSFSEQKLHFTYILSDGSEDIVSVDVSEFLSESEYGDGLKVVDHVISAKLGEDTATNKNFLDLEGSIAGQKSLAVRSMDTDVTHTTDRIIVAGGPLDSTALRNILPKDESGNAYIEGGTDIQSLLLSLFTKVEWPSPTVKEGKISTSIAEPSFTLSCSGTVEVGTTCTLSEATLSAVSSSTSARTCGEFTYGYSTSSSSLTNKGTKTVTINASNVTVNGDNYTMSRTFSGFTNASGSATPSTTASSVKIASASCVVTEGTNAVKVSVGGPKGVCTFAALPSYYVASNIYTLSTAHTSPSSSQVTITAGTAPSNSKTLSVTGNYKYFLGYSTNTAYNQFNSASVRALTSKSGWVTVNGTTTILNSTTSIKSNGTSIVIACPSKYKLATISNGVGADILPNFSSIGEVDVTTGSITTKYKVYVYPITNGAVVEFKNVTLTKA